MKPKGTLIAIGGNEEKEFSKLDEKFQADFGEGYILQHILAQARGRKSSVEIITSASSVPSLVGKKYIKTFKSLGAENVDVLDISDREEATNQEILDRIEQADVILFSGGDQSKITQTIRDTDVHKLLLDRYWNDDFIIAGTSAGAMVMSKEMITGGKNENIIRKNDLKMSKGLGLMKEVIFDSHFIRRGRFGRLAEAVASFPEKLGIGLGEDTGLIIKKGNICEIIGSGMVIFLDGSHFTHNQYHDLNDKVPISLANLIVHVLTTNDKYYIDEKKAEIYYNSRHHKKEVNEFE